MIELKKSSFIEGTIIATLAIIITKIMGMLYVIPFYSMVGEKGSALYAYGYNIYVIFLDISSAGLPLALSKIIKEYNTLKMMDAKKRAYHIGIKMVLFLSVLIFLFLILFANPLAQLIIGDLDGGNSVSDVAFVIRCVSLAILVVPLLSVAKGYLQGHNIINVSSVSQIIEQVFRITVILGGSFLAIHLFHFSLKNTIGLAITGAFVGGFIATLYVLIKMQKAKKELGLTQIKTKDAVTNKEIGKKIIRYAMPFIIINIIFSINNFMDMVMILRTLEHLGIDANTVEFATSAITTWSTKISMIVNSIATGMITSLIPTIVGAYTLKNYKEVENKFNKALQIILITCIPMCLGLSLLSKSVWRVFYGQNQMGSLIFSVQILVSLFYNLFLITNSTLHGLNKSKTVYESVGIGLTTNMVLNIPLMLLFYKLNWPPYLGAILSTAIGYILAFTLSLKKLNKEHQLSYKETYKTAKKILIPTGCMILSVLLLKKILPLNLNSRLYSIGYISIISLLGGGIYLFVSYKMGLLKSIFGEALLNKITKKLTRKGK